MDYKFLHRVVNNTISRLPKIIYLNDVVDEALNIFMPKVHIIIIMSYFHKCCKCSRFFDYDDIRVCRCSTWCKFCARMYLSDNGYCELCCKIDGNVRGDTKFLCIFPDCMNKANYGDVEYALYCSQHVMNGITINYFFRCFTQSCFKRGYYYGNEIACEEHKDDKSSLFLREGSRFMKIIASQKRKTKKKYSKYILYCEVCNNKCYVTYSCVSCNMHRCIKCAHLEMFFLFSVHTNDCTGLFCCNCVSDHMSDMSMAGCVFLAMAGCVFPAIPECTVCGDLSKNVDYSDYSFYCDGHSNKNCIKIAKKCGQGYCYATKLDKSVYCRFHTKKYNNSMSFNKIVLL